MAVIETWTGSNGAAWPAQWTTGGEATPAIFGNAGRLQASTAQSYRGAFGWANGQTTTADFDRLSTFSVSDTVEGSYVQAERVTNTTRDGGNSAFPTTGVSVYFSGTTVELYRNASGGFTQLATATFNLTAGVKYAVRFKGTGTTLQTKVWAASAVEPTSWTVTNTNASTPTNSGNSWFGWRGGGDSVGRYVTVDDFQDYATDVPAALQNGRWRADSVGGVANGAAITTWSDLSVGNSPVTQGTSTKRAVLASTGTPSGQPAATFDGTDDFYGGAIVSASAPAQTIAVYFKTGSAVNGSYTLRGGDTGGLQFRVDSGTLSLVNQNQAGLGNSLTGLSANTWYSGIVTYDSAVGAAFYLNGSADGTNTSTSGAFPSGNTTLGSNQGGGEFFNGQMAEVITWNRVLSSAEISQTSSYFNTRYASSTATASGAMGLNPKPTAVARPNLTAAVGLLLRPTAVARPNVTGAVAINMAPTGLVVYATSGAIGLGQTASATATAIVTGSATISMAPTASGVDLSRTGSIGLGAGLAGSATPIVTGSMSLTMVTTAGATNTSYGTGAMSLQPSLTATAVNLSVSGTISISMAVMASASSFYPTPPISPFDIKIWDVGNRFAGAISDPIYATFTPRFPGIGTGEIQVRSDSSLNAALQTPGASITVQYRKEHLFSGPVMSFNGSVVTGTITYQVADWWTLMKSTLAWVNPASPLEVKAQGGAYQLGTNANDPMHYSYGASSLPAETAIKRVVTDNFTRLGRAVSIEPDQARGGSITPPVTRFNTLQEVTETMAGSALWPRIRQVGGAGLTFEVNAAVTFPQVFTAQSGTVSEGTFSAQGPAATRVVLGGPGQDTDRAFFARNDTTGLEAAYGYAIEVFKDATSGTIDWPDEYADALKITREYLVNPDVAAANKASFLTTINESGKDALADGQPTSGLQVTLSEGDGFHYGGADGYHVGDTITVQVVGQVITEQVTECAISWSTSGLVVTPTLGQQSDDPSVLLYQTVVAIAAGLRRGSLRK